MDLIQGSLMAVATSALVWAGGEHIHGKNLTIQLAQEEAAWSQERAAQQKELARATEEVKQKDAALQAAVRGAEHELQREKDVGEERLAAERDANDRLRKQLTSYSAPARPAGGDTLAACRTRASALGDVLGSVLRDYAECTGAAEVNAAGVRALLSAWPGAGSF